MPYELPDNYDPFTIFGEFTPDKFRDLDWPDEHEKAICQVIDEKFEVAKAAKSARQQIVEYNYMLLQGETWIGRSRVDNEVLRIVRDGDPREGRSTDNIILDKHRAFVGKFTRAVPMARARARSNDKEDMVASTLIDSFIDYFRISQKVRLKYKRWVEAISPAGTGILHMFWNPDIGPAVAVCEECAFMSRDQKPGTPCPQCLRRQTMAIQGGALPSSEQMPLDGVAPPMEETLQDVPMLTEAREGDLETKLIQLRDFFPDPGATLDPATLQWCIVSSVMHVSEARRMFPDRTDFIEAQDGLYSERYIFAPANFKGTKIHTRDLADHVQLLMYLERPSGLHENGRVIYKIGDRIMAIQPLIEAKLLGRLPFFLARGDVHEDSLFGMDIISQAEPQQRERDMLVTQLRRFRDLHVNPPLLASTRSGLRNKRLTTTAGQIVKANFIDENHIKFMRTPQIPQYVPGELERLDVAAQRKFGVTPHELGMGDPGQSGRFAAILDTQANETIGPLAIEVDEELLEFHRAAVVLAQYYYSPERVWTTTSRGRVFSHSWGETNVLPGWDVYMVHVDAASKNPVIREQNARERLQLGYYTDTSTGIIDWDKFRMDAGLDLDVVGGDSEASEHMYAAELPQMVEAAITNQRFDQIPRPMPWDNAFIMASGLLEWLRTTGKTKPEPVVRAVAQIWFEYAMSLAPPAGQPMNPQVAEIMPNQRLMGNLQQPQTLGAGGSVPGQQAGQAKPGAGTPTAQQETAQKVATADRQAELASRTTRRHEG